jgi:hypothetical protein
MVKFALTETVPVSADRAWAALTDWPGHGRWIPATRVEVDPHDSQSFVAWSGLGPLALEDRMHADAPVIDGDTRRCRVDKLGPVLVGEAEFAVAPGAAPGSCEVSWREEVSVPYLPKVAAPLVGWTAAKLFSWSLRRMARMA